MKTFREYIKEKEDSSDDKKDLSETPVAVLGDWDGFKDKKSTHISYGAFLSKEYSIIGSTKYKDKEVLIVQKDNHYLMGTFGIEYKNKPNERKVFVVLIEAEIMPRKNIKDNFKYKKPVQVKKVEVTGEKRRGVGSTFYKYFLSKGYTIISDMIQFDGARKLYSSLSKHPGIQADIIDDSEYKTLIKDTIVDQGYEDWDFDDEIWSYGFEKANIRIALTAK
jgi:hypothetical protein